MAPEFALTEESIDDERHVIAVAGEIDLFTAPEMKATLIGAIDAGKTRIVVDLSRTTFLDSTALGVLIGAIKRLRARDGALTIVNTEPTIAKTFDVAGLDQIFTITETRDHAIAAPGAGPGKGGARRERAGGVGSPPADPPRDLPRLRGARANPGAIGGVMRPG